MLHTAWVGAEDLKFAVVALSAVFFVVDPFAAVPIFLAITRGDAQEKRKAAALRASLASFAILVLFALAGGYIFKALGITLGAFKMAGGLMLLLMALDMMRAQPSRTRSTAEEIKDGADKDDVALVPMAVPMLAGPGAIATVMVLMSRAAWRPVQVASVMAAVAITAVATWLLLRSAVVAEKFLRQTYLNALQRVMGLLLAAIAVEFIVGGLKDMLPGLG